MLFAVKTGYTNNIYVDWLSSMKLQSNLSTNSTIFGVT